MNGLPQDLRYAVRGLRRNPGFSAAAVLILGLGIGASTTIFGLVDALYLKTLPATEPSRLVEVYQTRRPGEYFNLSYLDYLFYRAHTRSLSGLAAHYSHGVTARDPLALGSASFLILATAVLSSLVPARRATRIDPIAALRLE